MAKALSRQNPLIAPAAALKTLRTKLSSAPANAGCHTFLATANRDSPIDRWQRVRFSKGLATHFRKAVIESLGDQLPTIQELVVFGYDDPGSMQTTVFAKDEYPDLAAWFNEVPEPTWTQMFKGNSEFLSKVVAHVTTIDVTGKGDILTIFKQRTATSLLRKRGMLAIFKRLLAISCG